MKYKKKIFITEDKKELYYGYFNTKKPKTIYKFRNLILYMNNKVGIDIENVIDREINLKIFSEIMIGDVNISHGDFHVYYIPFSLINTSDLYSNLKIVSEDHAVIYLIARNNSNIVGTVEFDIDMHNMYYNSFYIHLLHCDDKIIKCGLSFWNHKNKNSAINADKFNLIMNTTKYRKIIIDHSGIESNLIDPETVHAYNKFMLNHI